LQDQDSRDLVDQGALIPAGDACLDERLPGETGRQPLVPGNDWDANPPTQIVHETQRFLGLGSHRSVHVARQSYDDFAHLPLHDEGGDCLQVLARTHALDRVHTGREGCRVVGHGDTDSTISHIQAHVAHETVSIGGTGGNVPEPVKYKILSELGAGGMGKVYRGLLVGKENFQRPIVIKQVRREHDPNQVRMFVEEARRYAVLDHENIGRIFDFDEVEGQLCIILELIDGWSLVDYIERHRELDRQPDIELTVFIISRVCRALQYVYEKAEIVHRDVSPGNIMVTREGTVKLIDFGIATAAGTRENGLTGKPSYMAPEMVVELRADHRSDLFSLGSVFFELLTSTRLFLGRNTTEILEKVVTSPIPSPETLNPAVSPDVLAIVNRALKRPASERFESAAAMGQACEHFLYDKGYGPTNLSLKEYLVGLMPGPEERLASEAPTMFPVLEAMMIPIADGPDDATRAAESVVGPPHDSFSTLPAAAQGSADELVDELADELADDLANTPSTGPVGGPSGEPDGGPDASR